MVIFIIKLEMNCNLVLLNLNFVCYSSFLQTHKISEPQTGIELILNFVRYIELVFAKPKPERILESLNMNTKYREYYRKTCPVACFLSDFASAMKEGRDFYLVHEGEF